MPADTVDNGTWRRDRVPAEVWFGSAQAGHWHEVMIVARWKDRHGRDVVQIDWHAGLDTRSGEFITEPGKIREG